MNISVVSDPNIFKSNFPLDLSLNLILLHLKLILRNWKTIVWKIVRSAIYCTKWK